MAGPGRCGATGKRRYRDKREGIAVVHRARVAHRWAELDGTETRRRELRIYQCPSCLGWHATSSAALRAGRVGSGLRLAKIKIVFRAGWLETEREGAQIPLALMEADLWRRASRERRR